MSAFFLKIGSRRKQPNDPKASKLYRLLRLGLLIVVRRSGRLFPSDSEPSATTQRPRGVQTLAITSCATTSCLQIPSPSSLFFLTPIPSGMFVGHVDAACGFYGRTGVLYVAILTPKEGLSRSLMTITHLPGQSMTTCFILIHVQVGDHALLFASKNSS